MTALEKACPHCGTALPEEATFCAACGRRIAGWAKLPDQAGSAAPKAAPGGEEPTRQMEPTPSLLRAAALTRPKAPAASGPVETDSAIMRAVRRPSIGFPVIMTLVAAATAALGYFLFARDGRPKAVAQAPAATSAAPANAAPLTRPPAKPAAAAHAKVTRRRARGPHRAEALDVPSKKIKAALLPHKQPQPPARPEPPGAAAAPPPAPTAAPPEDLPTDSQSEASIDAAGVRLAVKQHLPQVKACYERAFKSSSPGGTVEIAFAIDPQGHAARVRTESNSTESEPLARCLESAVASWRFPRPVGGEYELIYPFVFSPGS